MRRAARLTLLAGLAVAAITMLAGCGQAVFKAGSAPDPHALAKDAGVVVLDQGTAENRYSGGASETWYAVGSEGSDEVHAVVNVLRFKDEKSRDAAFRQILFRMNRALANGVVYTAGDAVIEVSRIGDYGTVSDLNRALEAAGAL